MKPKALQFAIAIGLALACVLFTLSTLLGISAKSTAGVILCAVFIGCVHGSFLSGVRNAIQRPTYVFGATKLSKAMASISLAVMALLFALAVLAEVTHSMPAIVAICSVVGLALYHIGAEPVIEYLDRRHLHS